MYHKKHHLLHAGPEMSPSHLQLFHCLLAHSEETSYSICDLISPKIKFVVSFILSFSKISKLHHPSFLMIYIIYTQSYTYIIFVLYLPWKINYSFYSWLCKRRTWVWHFHSDLIISKPTKFLGNKIMSLTAAAVGCSRGEMGLIMRSSDTGLSGSFGLFPWQLQDQVIN